jgi:hypothetical protein
LGCDTPDPQFHLIFDPHTCDVKMWATGRRVVLVNWAARKIANWDVPYAEYNSPEEARVAVRAWLDEVVNRVQIVEGHYEDVTRLRVGGRTDIWGSLFQVCRFLQSTD